MTTILDADEWSLFESTTPREIEIIGNTDYLLLLHSKPFQGITYQTEFTWAVFSETGKYLGNKSTRWIPHNPRFLTIQKDPPLERNLIAFFPTKVIEKKKLEHKLIRREQLDTLVEK